MRANGARRGLIQEPLLWQSECAYEISANVRMVGFAFCRPAAGGHGRCGLCFGRRAVVRRH